jgi:transglutaminase-like putative cysteine protease
MNMKMRLFALLSLATLITRGVEPPSHFLLDARTVIESAKNVTREKYTDSDRMLIDNHVLEAYEKDGSSITWDDEYFKVLTEKGRRESSSFSLEFNTHYGTSMVYRAEIIKPDGRILTVDVDTYSRIMTDSGQMGMNIYDPANKVLTCAIPGLEINDLYHIVSCRIVRKAYVPNTWSDISIFEYDNPILKQDYEISAPSDLPLYHKILRAPVSNTVTYTETKLPTGRTRHLWQVRHVPQMFPEPNMPPLQTVAQRIMLSTTKDWRDISRWYWNLCQSAFKKTDAGMQPMVNKLIEGAFTRDDKIRSIFKFVSQEIRYMGITTEDTAPGYEPHEVGMTFKNRYGVCRDKAALLAVMLTMAGIQGYPVLIHAGAKMDPDVPTPYFNHAITAVEKPGGGYMLMDPTDENTRELCPAYLCNRSYLVARPEGEGLLTSDVYPAEKNLMRIQTDGTLDKTGSLVLKTRLDFDGINDNAYRGTLLRLKADQRRKMFEGFFKTRLAGAEVLECFIKPVNLQDTETPLSIELTTRVPNYPIRGHGLDTLSLPWLGGSLGYVNFVIEETGLDKRRYPMETQITCGLTERIMIRISDSLGKPYVIPSDFKIKKPGIEYRTTQTLKDGVLQGTLDYFITAPEFSPENYLLLKNVLKEMETNSRRRPLFEAFTKESPDQETLYSFSDVTLLSQSSWITTNICSSRILTYAGKKNGAELKLPYNPSWQEVEIVSATVSNTTGVVHAITPKEMNIMDAPWSASAPRYPAGKILVVNLPGVETGSVITVTTRYTQFKMPFYSQSKGFGGTEPIGSDTYRITFPKSMSPKLQQFNCDKIGFTVSTNKTSITWTWNVIKPPLIRPEELTPPWHFFQPELFLSFGTWNSYADELEEAVEKVSTGNKLARKLAKTLVKGESDSFKKMTAVRDTVLRTIRPSSVSFMDLPLSCLSTPDQTLTSQYGHIMDRAILLNAMLEAVGLNSEIVLASDDTTGYPKYSQPRHDNPIRRTFNHALVRVRIKGLTYYLNTGDQYDEPGTSAFHLAPCLTLEGKIETIQVPERFQPLSRNLMVIDLDEKGTASISITNWMTGASVGLFRKKYSEILPEDLRRHYLGMVESISKSAVATSGLHTDTRSYPGVLAYSMKTPNYAIVDGKALTLLIPGLSKTIFGLRGDARENPLFFNEKGSSISECIITLPRGYTTFPILPPSRQWDLPCGLGTFNLALTTSKRTDGRMIVRIVETQMRKSGEVPAQLYPALLEYNRLLSHPSARTLVAEKESK